MAVPTLSSLPADQQQIITKYISSKYGFKPGTIEFQNVLGPYLQKNDIGSLLKEANSYTSPSTTAPTAPVETIPGTDIAKASDRGQIETEASRENQQLLNVNQDATNLRSKGLGSLADILAKQNQAQFNYDLPGIKEDLQSSGLFSSPSALAAAVARESGMLGANTQAMLGQQGVNNINLQAEGLLGASQNSVGLEQGGLQRQFSVSDYDKQAQLAREIGAMSVPNSPSPLLTGLSGAAQGAAIGSVVPGIGTGVGAGVGGAIGLIGGAGSRKGGGGLTFICTHLNKLGLMTKEEVAQVHDKIFTKDFRHFYSFMAYCVLAPLFLLRMSLIDYPWADVKKSFCEDILACETSEEAFQKYKDNCLRMIRPVLPGLCNFFFGKETVHGY